MEVTALRVRLLMSVSLLLVDFSYSEKAAFPQVVPNRQQHFQYEPIGVSCEGLEGLTGWRVMRKIKLTVTTCASTWSTSTGPCRIKNAIPAPDSGEYWCDMGAKRSKAVNITVTAGSVILESPVLPVTEGDAVTLRCRKQQTSSNLTAEFFKDGRFMDSSSTGNVTIHSVSRSNEGLYKCSISGAGESAESWLAVRAAQEEPDPSPSPPRALLLPLLLCIGVSAFFVSVLLLLGLLRCRKPQTIITGTATSPSSFQCSSSPQTVSEEASGADLTQATYAVVTKPRKEKGSGVSSFSATSFPSAGY